MTSRRLSNPTGQKRQAGETVRTTAHWQKVHNMGPSPTPQMRLEGESPTRFYLAVLLAFTALYVLTAQRGPGWQDAGMLQWRAVNFDLAGWTAL